MIIEFIGKAVLITEGKERIVVVSDLHLGYGQSLRESGYQINVNLYKEIINNFELIFGKIGKVGKVIILGDLKHVFGSILRDEWKEVLDLLDYLKEKCKEIIIIKGNHDIFTEFIIKKRGIKIVDYYLASSYAFLHGDRDFEEIYSEKIKYWFVGHCHPAVMLKEGVKQEKYKCFLVGRFKGKKVIILPSFFPAVEGSYVKSLFGKEVGLAWDFNFDNFEVKIVDGLKVLEFGKLKEI